MSSYTKSYLGTLKFRTYSERLKYLRVETLTHELTRDELNRFYKSKEWMEVRELIIARDLGCDLGLSDCKIVGKAIVHHINPVTDADILSRHPRVLDPNNLITVSHETHNLIHYGGEKYVYEERKPGDTKLW